MRGFDARIDSMIVLMSTLIRGGFMSIESRRLARLRMDVLAVLGSIAAMALIALGTPVIGLSICIATLLPLILRD